MVDLDELRLVAALAHTIPDGDLEVRGPRSWIVSYHRPDAVLDPCGFRNLALATMRGCPLAVEVEAVAFVGALKPCGGGTFRRTGPKGEERRYATFLAPAAVHAVLDACPYELPDDAVHGELKTDDDLGVTVVSLTAPDRAFQRYLDELARWAAGMCLVEELVATPRDAWR